MHEIGMNLAYNIDIEIGMNLLDCIIVDEDREKAKINYDRALDGESHSAVDKYGENEPYYFETL